MPPLHIADGLDLPLDAVTQTFGILARKGAGKTYTALVIQEQMIRAGLKTCMLDPTGASWGIRYSADGKSEGVPITILGGQHGDVPLTDKMGSLVAEVVIEQPGSFLIDLSDFSTGAEQDRFVTAFAEKIYRGKSRRRDPMHLFIDEADSFAPQRPLEGQRTMLGMFEQIVRRGRVRGLGCTLITQRPAVLNKNVLTQVECLVALQITHKLDRTAIEEWVRGNADADEAREVINSLASLDVGNAWFWSPQWLKLLKRVQVGRRTTYDSSATPEVGQDAPLEPVALEPANLDSLREAMAAAMDELERNDPELLRGKIKELERELRSKPKPTVVEAPAPEPPAPVTIEVAAPPPPEIEKAMDLLRTSGSELREAVTSVRDMLEGVVDQVVTREIEAFELLNNAEEALDAAHAAAGSELSRTAPVARPAAGASQSPAAGAVPSTPAAARPVPTPEDADTSVTLGKAEKAALAVLRYYKGSRSEIGTLAGYSGAGGAWGNALSKLRTSGLVVGSDLIEITEAGLSLAPEHLPHGRGQDLVDYWKTKVGKAERLTLQALFEIHPETMSREVAAAACANVVDEDAQAYEASGGGYGNALSALRKQSLIIGKNDAMRAADALTW